KTIFEMWNPHSKEAFSLAAGAVAVAPLFPVAPGFTMGLWYTMGNYYRVHRKAHENPEWARKYLPWHYDHHMGRDQEQNWCVTFPFWDYVMGTRVPYIDTETEKKDIERKMRKAQKNAPTEEINNLS